MEIPVTIIDEAPFKEGLLIDFLPEVRCGIVVFQDGTVQTVVLENLKAHWTYDPELKRWRSDVESEGALIESLQEEVRVLTQQIEELYAYTRELEESATPEDPGDEDEETFS